MENRYHKSKFGVHFSFFRYDSKLPFGLFFTHFLKCLVHAPYIHNYIIRLNKEISEWVFNVLQNSAQQIK